LKCDFFRLIWTAHSTTGTGRFGTHSIGSKSRPPITPARCVGPTARRLRASSPTTSAISPRATTASQIEHGYLSEQDFKSFTFTNAVKLHGRTNPDFFKGTVVEKQAAVVLAES